MRSSMLAIAVVLGGTVSPVLAQPLILTVQERPQMSDSAPAQTQDRTPVQAQDQAPAQAPAEAPAEAPAQAQDRTESQGTSQAQSRDQERDQVRRRDDTSANTSSRYNFKRVDNGLLRLDNESGHIAYCAPHTVGWACQAVPEDRAALEKEIARLQDEVAALKKEVAGLRAPPPPPRPPADVTPHSENGGGLKLPSDQEIARARTAVEHAWRQLMDMLATMQKDMMRKVQPDRTTL